MLPSCFEHVDPAGRAGNKLWQTHIRDTRPWNDSRFLSLTLSNAVTVQWEEKGVLSPALSRRTGWGADGSGITGSVHEETWIKYKALNCVLQSCAYSPKTSSCTEFLLQCFQKMKYLKTEPNFNNVPRGDGIEHGVEAICQKGPDKDFSQQFQVTLDVIHICDFKSKRIFFLI